MMPNSSVNDAFARLVEFKKPIELFPSSVKKSFQLWIEEKNNRTIFDSGKRTRYKWILDVSNAPTSQLPVLNAELLENFCILVL